MARHRNAGIFLPGITRAVWLARGSFPWLVDDARDRGHRHARNALTGSQLGSLTKRLGNDSSRDRGSSNKHHGQDVDQEDAQRRQPRAQPPGCCRRPGCKCAY